MFVVIYYDTDGFTYSCTTVLGAYETRPEADERCLKAAATWNRKLEAFEVQELSFGDWDL